MLSCMYVIGKLLLVYVKFKTSLVIKVAWDSYLRGQDLPGVKGSRVKSPLWLIHQNIFSQFYGHFFLHSGSKGIVEKKIKIKKAVLTSNLIIA